MAKILVVDDSEDTLDLIEQVLGEEHQVFTLASWVNVSHYIYHHDLDLILVDVNMPCLSGDALTEILMEKVQSRRLNIVLFSGMDESELKQKAQAVNAKGYIPKTFDADLLRLRVQQFLK